jgi:GNAT superfamily N-acetyltransferase
MEFIVREAEIADVDPLFTLVEQFATSFKPSRESFEHSFQQLLPDKATYLLVAECESELVGYCLGFDHYTLYANGRVSWIEEIMVKDTLRGQGLGRALMKRMEAWAQSRNSNLVALATRRAAPFYQALGYEESATYFRKLVS